MIITKGQHETVAMEHGSSIEVITPATVFNVEVTQDTMDITLPSGVTVFSAELYGTWWVQITPRSLMA